MMDDEASVEISHHGDPNGESVPEAAEADPAVDPSHRVKTSLAGWSEIIRQSSRSRQSIRGGSITYPSVPRSAY